MKRKIFSILLTVVMLASFVVGTAACNIIQETKPTKPTEQTHTHTYSEEWSHNETFHWHAATCEHTSEISGKAEHTFVNEICSVCGYKKSTDIPVEPEKLFSSGLEYRLTSNNTYSVTGIGTCTDTKINIPSEYTAALHCMR